MKNEKRIIGEQEKYLHDETHRSKIHAALEGPKQIKVGKLAPVEVTYLDDLMNRSPKTHPLTHRPHLDDPKYKYFQVLSTTGETLGIIGLYDNETDINITNTIVDPKYRGQGLAQKFKDFLMEELNLPFLTLTIDFNSDAPNDPRETNVNSIKAAEKLPGAIRSYDANLHKAKFVYPKEGMRSKAEELIQIKNEIEQGALKNKTWEEKGAYRARLGKIGSSQLILQILGPDIVWEYLNALGEKNGPYTFILPLEKNRKELLEYLEYETSEKSGPAQLILDSFKSPFSPAGLNIFISHAKHVPNFRLSVIEHFKNKEAFKKFLTEVITQYPGAESTLKEIFNEK